MVERAHRSSPPPAAGRRLGAGLALLAFLCLTVALAPRARAQDEWLNIRLNSDTTTELQNEEQVAINPTDANNMVAVWRDFRLGYRQVAWGYTFDGGATWTDGGLFVEPNYPYQSDPGVTADRHGNFYAIVLSFTNTSSPNGFYVYKSTNGGVSWGPPMEVINGVPNVFEDKEFIACDRTDSPHADNLYVVWTRFYTTQILMRRSTNGGWLWDPTVTVSDQNGVQFPIPVVGPQGELYVAWTRYSPAAIMFDVSTDGGSSFGTDRQVTTVYTASTVLNGGINAYGSPHMDADISTGPYRGRVYVAFMDRRAGYGDFDIWVTSSDDQGVSWTTPVRVNDDPVNNGRDQFLPWLVVDNLGVVTVVFLDRRHDPQNRTYHCVLTQSFDGGATWEPNVQVSGVASDPQYAALAGPLDAGSESGTGGPAGAVGAAGDGPVPSVEPSRAGLLGEYIGVTSWNGRPTPIWTDIRNFHQDAYAGYLSGGAGVARPAAAAIGWRLPNPVAAGAGAAMRLTWRGADPPAGAPVRILDAQGRLLRLLEPAWRPAGAGFDAGLNWDGLDAAGGRLPAGVYLLRLDGAGSAAHKLVLAN